MKHVNETTGEITFTLPHEVVLDNPVPMGKEEKLEKVTFKNELTGAMVSELPAGGAAFFKIGHMYPLICKMTGEATPTINRMIYGDVEKCIEVVSSFLGSGQTTGSEE